jgi:two-component system, response regulator / RNA-binding antiterminator
MQDLADFSPPKRTRVVIVIDPGETSPQLDALWSGLDPERFEVVGTLMANTSLQEHLERLSPDLIVVGAESGWRDSVEQLCVVTQSSPRPIVLFTDNQDTRLVRRAFEAGVTAYVVAGLAPERVASVLDVAIARFDVEQGLRRQLADSKEKLNEHALVDQAKRILIKRVQLSEQDAYSRLRKLAMDKQESLAAAARRVIEAAQLLG